MSRCCIWRIFWTGIVITKIRLSGCDKILGGGGGGIFPVWKFFRAESVLCFCEDQRNEFAAISVSFWIAGAREFPPSPQPSPPGRGRNIFRILARLGGLCASSAESSAAPRTRTRRGACEERPSFPSAVGRVSLSLGERAGVRAGVTFTLSGQIFSGGAISIPFLLNRCGVNAAARGYSQRSSTRS